MEFEQIITRKDDLIGADLEVIIDWHQVMRGPIEDIFIKYEKLRFHVSWFAQKSLRLPIPWLGLDRLESAGLEGDWKKLMDRAKIYAAADDTLIWRDIDPPHMIKLIMEWGHLGIMHPKGLPQLEAKNVQGL